MEIYTVPNPDSHEWGKELAKTFTGETPLTEMVFEILESKRVGPFWIVLSEKEEAFVIEAAKKFIMREPSAWLLQFFLGKIIHGDDHYICGRSVFVSFINTESRLPTNEKTICRLAIWVDTNK